MKRKLCRTSRGRNASARSRRRSSGQIYRTVTIPVWSNYPRDVATRDSYGACAGSYHELSVMRDRFHWARLLTFVTGLVNQELLLRNEYLVAENRILRARLSSRL